MSTRKRRILIGDGIWMDLAKLIRTRLLIQANSGAGKSFLLRRILEQSNGSVQQIIIDVEGEFTSLREKYDYVLAAKDGDTPADPRGARLLAERLLEVKASAIIDLYELKHAERIRFVRLFLDAMVNAPKHLWHPVLIVLDEAHIFCPQQDRTESESASAVIDLCTRGRKRGFCAILATQRLSKLHKDAAAECNNKLVGRTSLDTDIKRVSDELGFNTKDDRQALRTLRPGEFYAYGPALSKTIERVMVGPVLTQHPKAGGARLSHMPKPTRAIKRLLPRLADLPAESEQREMTQQEIRKQNTELRATAKSLKKENELLKASKAAPKPPKPDPIFGADQAKKLRALLRVLPLKRIDLMISAAHSLSGRLKRIDVSIANALHTRPSPGALIEADRRYRGPDLKMPAMLGYAGVIPADVVKMLRGDKAEPRIAAVIREFPGANTKRISALSGVSAKRSTFRIVMRRLRVSGVVTHEHGSDAYRLTPMGEAACAHLPKPATGANAADDWRARLGATKARDMFDVLIGLAPDETISATRLSEKTGIPEHLSTFRAAFAKLKNFDLAIGDKRHGYRVNRELIA